MTCNLYSESETGLKFDTMSRSPGYCLHGTLNIKTPSICVLISAWLSASPTRVGGSCTYGVLRSAWKMYDRECCLGWYVYTLWKISCLRILFRVACMYAMKSVQVHRYCLWWYVCTLWRMCKSMSIAYGGMRVTIQIHDEKVGKVIRINTSEWSLRTPWNGS